jgi:lysophospholipase L1-like esterase
MGIGVDPSLVAQRKQTMKWIAILVLAVVSTMAFLGAGAPQATSGSTPSAGADRKPTLFLIGDSTVRNGRDDGSNGQWGWGHILPYYFDKSKITIENLAVGGTSSRTFMQNPTMWPRILPRVQAGDYVMMQFGHNDGTAPPERDNTRWRSVVRGNGEETVQGLVQSGGTETVHSFGWYLRKFIAETKEKGATPIACSLIPRNRWAEGKANRNDKDWGLWAKQAAEQGGALFIPLNDLIADKYDQMGQEKVTAEFFPPNETVHPNWAGSVLNAECVVEGLRKLDTPLKGFLLADAKAPALPDVVPVARGARGGRGAATAPATMPGR